ncbi:MAG: hypothetical protein IKP40_13930 [Clostridia bacterium]|nr:hypothetical protein [Clostridia bacterium]
MIEYTLRMTSDQARTADKAIELLLRLKMGQYETLPFALMDLGDEDFCDRRDTAKLFLRAAWCTMQGEVPPKDEEWYRLYNLHQALRYMRHEAEYPGRVGVDSYPPMVFSTEPLPGYEWREKE